MCCRLTRDVRSAETEERQSAQERICILRVDSTPKTVSNKEAPGGGYITLCSRLSTKEEKKVKPGEAPAPMPRLISSAAGDAYLYTLWTVEEDMKDDVEIGPQHK